LGRITHGNLLADLLVDDDVYECSRGDHAILPGDEFFKCHRIDKFLGSIIRSGKFISVVKIVERRTIYPLADEFANTVVNEQKEK